MVDSRTVVCTMNHRVRAICCFLILLDVTAACALAELPSAVPVDGEVFQARLAAVDAKWNLSFDSNAEERSLAAGDLIRWGNCPDASRGPFVVTADAGLLAADSESLTADRETLSAASALFGTLALPIESLCGVAFDLPAGRLQRERLLDRVARAAGRSDRVLLHNGDEIAGLLLALDADAVKLETDAGPIRIESSRIAALIFNPALRQKTPKEGLRCWAGFDDGSLLLATQLEMNQERLRISTVTGQTWSTTPEHLVWLMPLGGRVTYLSDLEPAEYRHVPYLNLRWPYRRDRSVTAGRLRCAGRLYQKGLGVHSTSRLTYRVDKPYRRFQAELGVDDSTAGRGSVRFRVFVDRKEKHRGETIRGGQPPVPVSVDVTGAERLDLIVDFADRADELDHADWLGARLVR